MIMKEIIRFTIGIFLRFSWVITNNCCCAYRRTAIPPGFIEITIQKMIFLYWINNKNKNLTIIVFDVIPFYQKQYFYQDVTL